MKYEYAEDLQERMAEMITLLEMKHVDPGRVKCFRSYGSSTKRTIARCHTIGKLMQKAIGVKAHYAIEFLEKFDKMSWDEQDKTIIHELMHIPKTFGGGFRNHDYVCDQNVDIMHEKFVSLKRKSFKKDIEEKRTFDSESNREENWRELFIDKDPRTNEGKKPPITKIGKGTLRLQDFFNKKS